MTRRIALRPRAEADLSEIWDYTAKTWSVDQANAYILALDQLLRSLADFPEMARLRREFTPPLPIHPFRQHVIVYAVEPDAIDVIRIVNGRASWAAFLVE